MPIRTNCPRCRKSLSVPSKKAGSYVNCPECNGRFWMPDNASSDSSPAVGADRSSGSTPAPPAAPPQQPPASRRKVARFISAEAAESTLKIAEDGQLPELHLQEGHRKEKPEAKRTTVNPLVLFGVISLSVVLSISLVLIDTEPEPTSENREKTDARNEIQHDYFAPLDPAKPLEPYQVYLREAHRAHTQKEYEKERTEYRKVLDLLRAERGKFQKGVTGSPGRDQHLEELISTLLSDDR